MKKVTLTVDDSLYAFYRKVGENAGGLQPGEVMADALFKLAGELSLNAMKEKTQKERRRAKRFKIAIPAALQDQTPTDAPIGAPSGAPSAPL